VILVDTSVWVEHLRHGDDRLAALLEHELVLVQPHVIGELALGQPHQRDAVSNLMDPPLANVASDAEVLNLIDRQPLFGIGTGYVGLSHDLFKIVRQAACEFERSDAARQWSHVTISNLAFRRIAWGGCPNARWKARRMRS
jgi:hypothetical protein